MTTFDDARLPEDVESGATGGPGFKTTVITLVSGKEQRNQDWSIARGRWNIGYGIRSTADLNAVVAFFMARRGRARGFRFKDWSDYQVTAELVGAGDDGTHRVLQKTYTDSVNPYVRRLICPVASTLIVYVNGFVVDLTTDYTLEADGVLAFTGGDPGADVRASFEFDVPARFDIDELPVNITNFLSGEISSFPIVEVK